jgi:phosphate transport system substrate-binding protein
MGIGALVLGCTSPNPTTTPAAGSTTPVALSGSIDVIGSTSVGPYAEELAAAFDAKNNNRTSVGISQVGSGPGIKAVSDGTTDVGMSSRDLTSDEKSNGLVTYKICDDGIAVIVNKANPINSLTVDQIRDIFARNVTGWKQFGGDDKDIIVVTREAGSGTRDGFETLVMQKKANITSQAIQQGSTGGVSTYVAGNKYAIGYISYGSLDTSQVNAIAVNGVTPSVATIKDKTYLIQRPFLFVTKGEATELSKAFIDYVLSPEGQAKLASHNLVTVS